MSTPLLQFPTDYPLKVVGRASEELRSTIDAIVARHVPDYDASRTRSRASANGNFLSLSYVIHAQSAEQVTALATELRSCEAVLLVL